MGFETGGADRLITRREFADLADVRRETISTWAHRHGDFPEPIRSGGSEYFSLNDVLTWLAGRPIPVKALLPGESDGATYVDRANRRLAGSASDVRPDGEPVAPVGLPSASGLRGPERLPAELFGSLAEQIRGPGSLADYLYLLLALLLVRRRAWSEWARISRSVMSATSDTCDPYELVSRVGHITDEVLRVRGVPPGVRASIERLRPRHVEDLAEVVRLCGELGDEAFGSLLARLEEATRPDSREFHTPEEVARLMAGMLVLDETESPQVHDPYLRGGELLAAVAATGRRSPELRGEHPSIDGVRLAGMRLAFQGLPARLAVGTSAPWTDNGRPRPQADVVLTNPPFNASGSATYLREAIHWPFGPPPPGNDNYAWLQYAFASLRDTGRAAVIMSNNASTSTNPQEQAIRARMVDAGVVECVLALPPRLFSLTPVAVSVWFLTRAPAEHRSVLLIDATGLGTVRRGRRSLSERELDAIVGCHKAWRSGTEQGPWELDGSPIATPVPVEEIGRQEYALVPSYYVTDARQSRPEPGAGAGEWRAELWGAVVDARERTESLLSGFPEGSPLRTGAERHGGWTEVPLADLCEIQSGPSPSWLKKLGGSGRPGDGVPILESKHLTEHRIAIVDAKTLPYDAAARAARFLVREGDILSVRVASIGRSALVRREQDGTVLGTNLLRLRPREAAQVDAEYLLGFLNQPGAVEWIRRRSSGTAVPFITAETLGRLPVRLPPLPEQQLIGSALRALDEQIIAHRAYAMALRLKWAGLIDELTPPA